MTRATTRLNNTCNQVSPATYIYPILGLALEPLHTSREWSRRGGATTRLNNACNQVSLAAYSGYRGASLTRTHPLP